LSVENLSSYVKYLKEIFLSGSEVRLIKALYLSIIIQIKQLLYVLKFIEKLLRTRHMLYVVQILSVPRHILNAVEIPLTQFVVIMTRVSRMRDSNSFTVCLTQITCLRAGVVFKWSALDSRWHRVTFSRTGNKIDIVHCYIVVWWQDGVVHCCIPTKFMIDYRSRRKTVKN
jgi:hypothetical protein